MNADTDRDLLPLFPEHSSVTPEGELAIGGVGVRDLAERFGTPAYIVDEAGLRNQARRMRDGLAARHPDSEVVFASKSFPCLAAYKLFAAEGLSIDVARAGELVMALAAGVRPERMYLHGNAKTTAELTMALEAGVGCVVVDNFDDIDRLDSWPPSAAGADPDHPRDRAADPRVAVHRRRRLQVRAAPGPGPRGDRRIRASQKLRLDGLHLHIGSQILDTEPFARAVEAVAVLGTFDVYDGGGGLGVRYTLADRAPPSSSTWTPSPKPPAAACRPAPSS